MQSSTGVWGFTIPIKTGNRMTSWRWSGTSDWYCIYVCTRICCIHSGKPRSWFTVCTEIILRPYLMTYWTPINDHFCQKWHLLQLYHLLPPSVALTFLFLPRTNKSMNTKLFSIISTKSTEVYAQLRIALLISACMANEWAASSQIYIKLRKITTEPIR